MRAVVVSETGVPGAMGIETVPDPDAGPGEVVIETRAIGLNVPDLLMLRGAAPHPATPKPPFTPGKEAAGVVQAVGEGVRTFAVGDRVLAALDHGAYAERIKAAETRCFPMPEGLGFQEAVGLGLAYQTAWFALMDRAHFVGGERVLVTGASGSVGLAAVQLAKARGGAVLALVRRDAQAGFVRAHGADVVVRLDADDSHDSLAGQVLEWTHGLGADIAIDAVGGDVFGAALRALSWRGRMVLVGFASGRIPDVEAGMLLVKNITVSGLQWSDYRDRDAPWVGRVQREIFDLHAKGRLKPVIAGVSSLDRFDEALAVLEKGGVKGQLMLVPGDVT